MNVVIGLHALALREQVGALLLAHSFCGARRHVRFGEQAKLIDLLKTVRCDAVSDAIADQMYLDDQTLGFKARQRLANGGLGDVERAGQGIDRKLGARRNAVGHQLLEQPGMNLFGQCRGAPDVGQ